MNAVPQTGDDFTEVGAAASGRSGAQSWRVAVGAGALKFEVTARDGIGREGAMNFSCVAGETIAFLHSKAIGAVCINPCGASMVVVLVAHPVHTNMSIHNQQRLMAARSITAAPYLESCAGIGSPCGLKIQSNYGSSYMFVIPGTSVKSALRQDKLQILFKSRSSP